MRTPRAVRARRAAPDGGAIGGGGAGAGPYAPAMAGTYPAEAAGPERMAASSPGARTSPARSVGRRRWVMICDACKERRHQDCRGGTWCDCQHRRLDDRRPEPAENWRHQG
nr:hypothetical protein [Actinomycetales bacterium]